MPFVIPTDPDAKRRNLYRLCLLRALLILVLAGASLFSAGREGWALPLDGGILTALFLLILFNAWSLWRLRRQSQVGEGDLLWQLVVDVVLMTLVFARSGAASNPFVSWYLVPLAIASATQGLRFALALSAFTGLAYSFLLAQSQALPWFTSHAGWAQATAHMHAESFSWHVLGMWLNFILSAGIITFFVSRMSGALRDQDQALALQHERLLQHEQVVALGALAAGAAHELGTPLSTMTVIARDLDTELANHFPADNRVREDVAILRQQLALCREVLQSLREQTLSPPRMDLSDYLHALVERLRVLHPACCFELSPALPALSVQPPATLAQVLTSLLDNAAQAAHSRVGLTVLAQTAGCVIRVQDDGPGISPEIHARLGQAFVSSRENGLGLGYFLSHATINQLGGRLQFSSPAAGGTLTELYLPWAALQAEAL